MIKTHIHVLCIKQEEHVPTPLQNISMISYVVSRISSILSSFTWTMPSIMGNYTLTHPTRSHIRKLLFTQYNKQEKSEQENLLHCAQCTIEFQKNEQIHFHSTNTASIDCLNICECLSSASE